MSLDRAMVFWLAVLPVAVLADDGVSDRVHFGRQIFEQNWLRPPADDSPLAGPRRGDGLGPLFNGASCVECHHLGGVGGAGANEHNVEIVSLALPLGTPKKVARRVAAKAQATHPGFLESLDVFLHHFGRDRNGSMQRYDDFRRGLRGMFSAELLPASETEQTFGDGLRYQLAQRNTPALFGTGLIDKISPSEVLQLAVLQKRDHPEVAGRATHAGAGRFGWRGQTASLEEFVRTACAAELGLRVLSSQGRRVEDQPKWPVDGPVKDTSTRPPVDLAENQVDALVAYVRAIPAPQQVLPEQFHERIAVEAGRQSFDELGCAVCHVANVGPAKDVFSDFLLHRMGSTFADRVAAPLPPSRVQQLVIRGSSSGGGGYSGGSSIRPTTRVVEIPPSLGELTAATEEFRTPPLWGVADSAPYLHDGRAETLDEAISLHAGQAESAAQRYRDLDNEQRSELLAFLGTLRAPTDE